MKWVVALALVAAFGALVVGTGAALAGDRTTFSGCILERQDSTIILSTSGDELVTIDTSWLRSGVLDAVGNDCVTVTTMLVDGRFVAESLEVGDEPNEVNSITKETTADRENRAKLRQERDDKGDKKKND